MSDAELKKEAIRFVNERRKELGMRAVGRLSKGYSSAAGVGTLAQSLEKVGVRLAFAEGDSVLLWGKVKENHWRVKRYKDPAVAEFMRALDEKRFPELIK